MNNFIKNKYHKWYMELCNSRKQLDRVKQSNIYFESHHIIPQCLGGSNKKSNLVLLTAKEHFVAHLLLTKFTKDKERHKMLCAIIFMAGNKKYNSKQYSKLKNEFSIYQSKQNSGKGNAMYGLKGMEHPAFGYKATPEANLLRSIKMSGTNNHFYGKFGNENPFYGKNHTTTTKEKMRKSKSIGVYYTPFGNIYSAYEIKNKTKLIKSSALRNWCMNPNKTITPQIKGKSKYLSNLSSCPIGKSFKELGFDFTPTKRV